MKVLFVHNYYGSAAPSGENRAFEAERRLVEAHGHEVSSFTRHSDEIRSQGRRGTLQGALSAPWNPFAARRLRRQIAVVQPDILHVHNTFPLISPAIYRTARHCGTPTVLTLHNYRTFCANGIVTRNDQICVDCLTRHSVWPALRYGCYRDSRLATLPMALMIGLHRRLHTWEKVDAFIALNPQQQEALQKAGLPGGRVHCKPHFLEDPPRPVPWHERQPQVVFVGRLGRFKGVHVLLEAWRLWGMAAPPLIVVGNGPEQDALERQSRESGLAERVRFLGGQSPKKAREILADSRLLVLPSLCFEAFPMAILEAFAAGVPVAASNHGGMAAMVETGRQGVLFDPGNAASLLQVIRPAWECPAELARMGQEALAKYHRLYSAAGNYQILMDIYAAARQSARNRRGP